MFTASADYVVETLPSYLYDSSAASFSCFWTTLAKKQYSDVNRLMSCTYTTNAYVVHLIFECAQRAECELENLKNLAVTAHIRKESHEPMPRPDIAKRSRHEHKRIDRLPAHL